MSGRRLIRCWIAGALVNWAFDLSAVQIVAFTAAVILVLPLPMWGDAR